MTETPADYISGEAPALSEAQRLMQWQQISASAVGAIAQRDARIELLERALLKTWEGLDSATGTRFCRVCERQVEGFPRVALHTPECLIPDLMERYGGSDA